MGEKWTGVDCSGLGLSGLDWNGQSKMDWSGLDWVGVDWSGLDTGSVKRRPTKGYAPVQGATKENLEEQKSPKGKPSKLTSEKPISFKVA